MSINFRTTFKIKTGYLVEIVTPEVILMYYKKSNKKQKCWECTTTSNQHKRSQQQMKLKLLQKKWSKETATGRIVGKNVAEKISKATSKSTCKDGPSKSTGPVQISETRIQLIEILKEKYIPPVKGL